MIDDRKRDRGRSEKQWLITYSDMVTLLLAFFVLLLSFSTINVEKFEQAIMSLKYSLGLLEGGRTVSSPEPAVDLSDAAYQKQMEALQISQLQQVGQQLRARVGEMEVTSGVNFRLTERGLVIQFTDNVLFDSGSAELLEGAKKVLKGLIPIIEQAPNHIRIEGHTDNVPINTKNYPSNWELSTSRATNVLRFLLQNGEFRPARLSAAGYGEFRPIASNDTAEGRAKNRRVDVILLRLGAEKLEPEGG